MIESHFRDGRPSYEAVEKLLRGIGYETQTEEFRLSDGDSAGVLTWASQPVI